MMKSRLALGLTLLLFAGTAWCDFSTLPGLWDISGKTVLRANFDGLKLKNPVRTVRSLTQFNGDGSWSAFYDLTYGINVTTPGNWTTDGRNYAVSIDAAAATSQQSNYLFALRNQFADLVNTMTRPEPNAVITNLTVTSYAETGKLSRNGLRLKGRSQISGEISFAMTNTATPDRIVTASFVATTRYTGVRASAPSTCCTDPNDNSAESLAFLEENRLIPGVRQTASGLQYKVIETGKGARPLYSDFVIVSYRGSLPNGEVFDASSGNSGPSGAGFQVSAVIKGWLEGLQLMKEGAWYRLYVPANLAFGNASRGSFIKPNSALIYDVHLLQVNP
jgi:FKBP-type peptidyl-prolyl cis-trans isomerase FkpA